MGLCCCLMSTNRDPDSIKVRRFCFHDWAGAIATNRPERPNGHGLDARSQGPTQWTRCAKVNDSMYENVPVHAMIARVTHIYELYRSEAKSRTRRAEKDRIRLSFLRGVIDNLQHRQSTLSPQTLAGLARHAGLTIGGAFQLVGYPLDRLREIEYLLNGHRTRIIESYPFYLDREVDLPASFADEEALQRSSLLADIVPEWQRKRNIRSVLGKEWRQREMFYVQLGHEDGPSLSGIPTGAIVSVGPTVPEEIWRPNPSSIYCLQFKDGYRCSRCDVVKGQLVLLPYDNNYRGRCEFYYPAEVRIVGRAQGFAVSLPEAETRPRPSHRKERGAPLILPWEQNNLAALWHAQYLRFDLDEETFMRANDICASRLGITMGRRTLRRYRYEGGIIPHTGQLVAMSLFHGSRFSDVFRLLGLQQEEAGRYSLATWERARSLEDLPRLQHSATAPKPSSQWDSILKLWGEWPALLSMALPNLGELRHRLLRVEQSQIFDGLSPLLRSGTFALLEEMESLPPVGNDWGESDWKRAIYAIRYKTHILCGYLHNDGDHVTLLPHIKSRARRLTFLRHQVQMVGKWTGVAAPLRVADARPEARATH